jgi:putative beta-lysine N-acetyltransferase
MPDLVAAIGNSTVQHGSENDRVYLMHLADADMPEIPGRLVALAGERGYTKVIARVPAPALDGFFRAGYHVEAAVPGLYRRREDGFFVAMFLDPARSADPSAVLDRRLLLDGPSDRRTALPEGCRIEEAGPEDAAGIAELYAETFDTYPFPIDDPEHLERSMAGDVRFFVVRRDGGIAAASSAEIDPDGENVEMTDFAVRPACRGLGLSAALLEAMEEAMGDLGMKTAYTICRAGWYPVNRLFAGAGYRYGGTLINNTQICGGCESMHVWHRPLRRFQKP